jgi:aryl-alcohol dehydrogenase-like predicted oxidoreductase
VMRGPFTYERPLGATGVMVGPIGLGLAALGRPEYINLERDADLGPDRSVVAMEQRCHAVLDAAWASGVRYVDAARSYGRAESFLASWLERRRLEPGAVVVGSKWGYTYTADWRPGARTHEVKDLSVAALDRQVEESRGLLGRHLRLYQIHSATLESGVLEDTDVLAGLVRLRSEGLLVGLTVSGPAQAAAIRRALQVSVDGVNPFQVVQATWNLLDVSAGPALTEARSAGWGVIVKEPLANGRLTDRAAEPRLTPVREQAAALGTTLDALSIAAALAQPWTDLVLSGAVTPGQLRSNLAALDLGDVAVRLPSVALDPQDYWAERSGLGWG